MSDTTIYEDVSNLQYIPRGMESAELIGGELFVGLGNFDFFNSAKEQGRACE